MSILSVAGVERSVRIEHKILDFILFISLVSFVPLGPKISRPAN